MNRGGRGGGGGEEGGFPTPNPRTMTT